MLNRRETTKLIVASAAAAALPGAARAASREVWIQSVRRELRRATRPGSGTKLSLTRFGFGKRGPRVVVSAVVRMDWGPGFRTRRFEIRGEGETKLFKELMAKIKAEFRRANPGGIV